MDMETLLGKFGFEPEGNVPVKIDRIDRELILKQMRTNGLLLEDSIKKMLSGESGHNKGLIRVSSWGTEDIAKVLLTNGEWFYHCADFLIANSEDELTTEDEVKRTDAYFRHHFFGPERAEETSGFMGLRKTLRPLKWEITDIKGNEVKVGARVVENKDDIYFYDRDYWLKQVRPSIQRYDNEVEIYMALFNYACILHAGVHGYHKAYNGKNRELAIRLEKNVNGLLRMLMANRNNLVVGRKMPSVRGKEVEDLYKRVFMNPGKCELFKAKCKSEKGECVGVEPYWIR